MLSVSSWICQIIVAGNHDPQIPQSPDEIETLEIQKLMRSLVKIEEDEHAQRWIEYEDEVKRRIAFSTQKRLRIELESWIELSRVVSERRSTDFLTIRNLRGASRIY